MNLKLQNKIALVTGASRGIGAATAKRLAADGATVLVHYGANQKSAEEVAASITAAGGKAFLIGADLGVSEGPATLAAGVKALLATNNLGDKLDILVNNAGVAEYTGLADTTEAQFDRLFQINVKSLFFTIQKLIDLIPNGGRIINLSSIVSRTAFPGVLPYSATKGAVDTLTVHLAATLGAREITVNAIAPGAIETDMSSWLRSPEGEATARSIQAIPRVGRAEDIADAIASIAGPDGRWITGQVIEVSGGSKL
jgi:3-oxoacyl-[acyl-carrier protein] reductase